MTQRTCGPCTACCQGWLHSKKLEMRPGHPCRHLVQQGCSIYPDRPEKPCKLFVCGWLQDAETYPDEMRPDRSGVIMLTDRKWHNWDVIRAVPAGRNARAVLRAAGIRRRVHGAQAVRIRLAPLRRGSEVRHRARGRFQDVIGLARSATSRRRLRGKLSLR